MATQSRPTKLDAMLERFARVPIQGLADAGSREMKERCARADLKNRGIELRGHKTAINELVRYEIERRRARQAYYDGCADVVLESPADGRPNQHSALRDLMIYAHRCFSLSKAFAPENPRSLRDARKSTAQFFGLTCDTRTARTRRPSTDQIKWAEDRTLARFERIYHLDRGQLLTEGMVWSLQAIGKYRAELDGRPTAVADLEVHVANLASLCRLLDALQHAARFNKADARALKDATLIGPKRELH